MPLARRAVKSWRNFNLPISYRLGEDRDRLFDAKNVMSIQNRLDTRHGISRVNTTSLGGNILSCSFFKDAAGNRKKLAKVGATIFNVASSGASSSILGSESLTANTKYDAIDFNRGTKNRQIFGVESDGLFSYDGTTFTQLGQDPPTAPNAVKAAGGSLVDATYQVALTFFSSSLGFETNQGAATGDVTTSSSDNTINVSSIPTTANNAFIDKVRIYLRDVTAAGSFLFIEEINLGTSVSTITANSTSSQVPPTKNAKFPSGGGKFLTEFESKLIVVGNDNEGSTVYFSEVDLPDAFDDVGTTQTRLYISESGDISGIATARFNDAAIFPYLVIFKKFSTHIYTTANGVINISRSVGCISHRTIEIVDGDVNFMSANGWRTVRNGRIVQTEKGKESTLGGGDIDDIFKSNGYVNELNKSQFANFFSVIYSELNQYITFVAEGSNTAFNKAYVYEPALQGFKVFEFQNNLTSAASRRTRG